MAVSTIDSSGLTSPLTSGVTTNTVTSAAATALTLQSAGTTAVTVDTSQNVSVGSATNTTYGKLSVFNAQSDGNQTIANSGILFANSVGGQFAQAAIWPFGSSGFAGALLFGTSPSGSGTFTPTERMRIDSSGNLLVGNSSVGGTGWSMYPTGYAITNGSTSTFTHISFQTSSSQKGYIQTVGATTNYNGSSDYRLKKNVTPLPNALQTIAQLKPVKFNWIEDNSVAYSFIAHELQEVVPQAVGGTKDEVDENGNPVYQGIDQSKLVCFLTAAIQELKAELDELKAKVNA